MPYTKTVWSDRQVQNPMQFTMTGNVANGGTVTLTPAEGNILQPGTPITADNLNNIETQYDETLNDCVNKTDVGGVYGYSSVGQSFNSGFIVFPIASYIQEINSNLYSSDGNTRIIFKKAGLYLVNFACERTDLPANQTWKIGFAINDDSSKMWTRSMIMGQYGWTQTGGTNKSKVPLSISHMVRVNVNDYINFNNNSDDGPRGYNDIVFSVMRVSD